MEIRFYSFVSLFNFLFFFCSNVGISGLWGRQCKESTIAKENCALRCLSPACYELIYGGDPVRIYGINSYYRSDKISPFLIPKYLHLILGVA